MLGKYRHSWIQLSKKILTNSKSLLSQKISEIIYKYFIGFIKDSVSIRPSLDYRISFTLLNSNPSDFQPSWDIENALKSYILLYIFLF